MLIETIGGGKKDVEVGTIGKLVDVSNGVGSGDELSGTSSLSLSSSSVAVGVKVGVDVGVKVRVKVGGNVGVKRPELLMVRAAVRPWYHPQAAGIHAHGVEIEPDLDSRYVVSSPPAIGPVGVGPSLRYVGVPTHVCVPQRVADVVVSIVPI